VVSTVAEAIDRQEKNAKDKVEKSGNAQVQRNFRAILADLIP
jgi:hypothetical protein